MYKDKHLTCRDCGKEFIFLAGEQEFYETHGFGTEPTRCSECRRIRKQSMRKREIFEVVCSRCGRVDTIPFEPRHDIPIFCRRCHKELNEE